MIGWMAVQVTGKYNSESAKVCFYVAVVYWLLASSFFVMFLDTSQFLTNIGRHY